MNEFKVKRVKNGWILEYITAPKSEFMQEVYTDGYGLQTRVEDLIFNMVEPQDELRTLVLALPKVEGEIMVSESLVLAEDPDMCSDMSAKDEANAYAALLQHRQGME